MLGRHSSDDRQLALRKDSTCTASRRSHQYRQVGPWRDYLVGERTYIVMSLVAKSLLAWLIFANVLRS